MNLIQKQADDFYIIHINDSGEYQDLVNSVRTQILEYNKDSHKIEFLDRIKVLLKVDYDEHLESCDFIGENRLDCRYNSYYENCLFFVQNEIDDIYSILPDFEFSLSQRNDIDSALNQVLEDLRYLKKGQELTYNELYEQLVELKEYYYISKKPWTQMLLGKLTEMVAGGLISETVSKEIVSTVIENYPGLISSL